MIGKFLSTTAVHLLFLCCPYRVAGRTLAHLGAGIDADFSAAALSKPPLAEPPSSPAATPEPGGSSLAAQLRQFASSAQLKVTALWNSTSDPLNGDNSQAPGPTLFAAIPLAISIYFSLRWILHRNRPSEPFETPAEVARQRQLFDDASKGTIGGLSNQFRWLELLRTYSKIIAGVLIVCVLSFLVLPHLDFSYIIIGCFAAVALVYDRQVNQVILEGQKKSGIDLAA